MKKNKAKPLQTFSDRVREIVRAIPKGEVLSYAEVAVKAGNPRAYRAVAHVMSHNFDTSVPCHRVIHSDGTLSEYNRGGQKKKYTLLLAEGVAVYKKGNTYCVA